MKLLDERIIPLKVFCDDKVASIRCDLESSDIQVPRLAIDGILLNESKPIRMSGICKDSLVVVVTSSFDRISIRAKQIDSLSFSDVIARIDDTARDAMQKILEVAPRTSDNEDWLRVPLDRLRLKFGETLLEEDRLLESYGIGSFDSLEVVPAPDQLLRIFAKCGRRQAVAVDSSTSISDLKQKLGRQTLTFNDHQLGEDRTLGDYGIKNDDEIEVVDPLSIWVKTLTGLTFKLDVRINFTVERLRQLIERASNIPIDQQRVVFNGKQLLDEEILADHNIANESVLNVIIRLRGGGGVLSFADISNNDALKKVEFSCSAPQWRVVSRGLNIEGRCSNSHCQANGSMVICPIGLNKFSLVHDRSRGRFTRR